jgi:hypothetical protein
MKTFEMKIALFSFLTMSLVFISCNKDEDDKNGTINVSVVDTARAAQTDNIVEGTLNIMENGYVEMVDGRNSNVSFFPECAMITILPNGDGGTIILDFGEECQLNNGSIVSGKINLVYTPIVAGTRTIDYTFENYFYNSNGVTGGGQMFREIANQNGNPQSTVNETIMVSFPNTDVTATRNGLRIAEWVEGVGSGTWLDNVYHITGNWDTNLTNGFHRSGEVTEKLVRKLSCLYLVSGSLEIEQEGITGVLDFGDGTCDNLATLTVNGHVIQIIL